MRRERDIQAEGGVNRRWRKEVQSIPAMNACLTYTVKHIQKGLTLLGDDIRLHFQGSTVDAKGKAKMNPSSADETYTSLLASLRSAMKRLAKQIEPKVYEYGFLKK